MQDTRRYELSHAKEGMLVN
jgi:hypothetical protein